MLRILAKLAFIASLSVLAACKPGPGDRCNPLLFNDDCHDSTNNLMCVYPSYCGVAYCCPVDADGGLLPSSNPNCQSCPNLDAGTTD